MSNQDNNSLNEMGRMIALARRLADEGQVNLDKTLEAIVYARIRRAAWEYRPEVTAQTMRGELARCLDDLRQWDIEPGLVGVLETGQRALEAQEGWDLRIEEAPDVFVCRTCGFTALGAAPETCPDCGAWPDNFRRFVALFNKDSDEPTHPLYILSLLQRTADDLKSLVEPLSEEQLSHSPVEDVWSIRDHVAHFYDTQVMLETRIKLMREHDDPELTALAVYEYATDADRHQTTAHAILSAFVMMRTKVMQELHEMPLEDLWRTGRHPEFGRITILRQAAYLAYHELSHLAEIKRLITGL